MYKSDNVGRPNLDGISFPSISEDVQIWLEREFEEEEDSRALEDCEGDKGPDPDGFNFSFIKGSWDFLKEDFGNLLSDLHRRGRINKEMNATFITLIPKVPNPVSLHDYRPISLVWCLYKLLAKILVNWLRRVIPLIISPFQGVFGAKRQILDGVLFANELIGSRKRSKEEGVIFKIDLEKAYDYVGLDFVDYMLLRFCFRETWHGWMRKCISTTSFSLLVYGSQSKLFNASRGI